MADGSENSLPQETSGGEKLKNRHYYIIKTISLIAVLYGIFLTIFYAYLGYTLSHLPGIMSIFITDEFIQKVTQTSGFGILAGLAGAVAGALLFFFRKWGFYLTVLSVLMLWAVCWFMIGGISSNRLILAIPTLSAIYLVWQSKYILTYRDRFKKINQQ